MSVSRAHKLEKEPPVAEEVAINPPPGAPDLHPAVLALVARVDKFDYNTPRLAEQPDHRLGTPSKLSQDKPDGLFKRLYKVFKHDR